MFNESVMFSKLYVHKYLVIHMSLLRNKVYLINTQYCTKNWNEISMTISHHFSKNSGFMFFLRKRCHMIKKVFVFSSLRAGARSYAVGLYSMLWVRLLFPGCIRRHTSEVENFLWSYDSNFISKNGTAIFWTKNGTAISWRKTELYAHEKVHVLLVPYRCTKLCGTIVQRAVSMHPDSRPSKEFYFWCQKFCMIIRLYLLSKNCNCYFLNKKRRFLVLG